MDILNEINKTELRKKAIDQLIEAQNKIINDCIDRYNFYMIELEKIKILETLCDCDIDNLELSNRYNEEINSALNEAKQSIELKIKLENLK